MTLSDVMREGTYSSHCSGWMLVEGPDHDVKACCPMVNALSVVASEAEWEDLVESYFEDGFHSKLMQLLGSYFPEAQAHVTPMKCPFCWIWEDTVQSLVVHMVDMHYMDNVAVANYLKEIGL